MSKARLALLKRIMKKHNKTCAEVGALVGRRAQTVREWRSGRYPVPSYATKILTLLLGP